MRLTEARQLALTRQGPRLWKSRSLFPMGTRDDVDSDTQGQNPATLPRLSAIVDIARHLAYRYLGPAKVRNAQTAFESYENASHLKVAAARRSIREFVLLGESLDFSALDSERSEAEVDLRKTMVPNRRASLTMRHLSR